MKKIILVINLFILLFFLIGCNQSHYWDIGWSMSDEEFITDYRDKNINYLEQLKLKYNIISDKEVLIYDDLKGFNIIMYNDEFTLEIHFRNDSSSAFLRLYFEFWNEDMNILRDYSKQSTYINFINEYLNEFAYDTIEEYNCFEDIFNKALNNDGFGSNVYHYDSAIGNVGYWINIGTTHYKQYSDDNSNGEQGLCNYYWFEGLCDLVE